MKTLNTTTFRNLTLTLGLLVLGFISKAQPYAPLANATDFRFNPNTASSDGLDLWSDFGWRKNSTAVTFTTASNNNSIKVLKFPAGTTRNWVRTIDFLLVNATNFSFDFTTRISNSGNSNQRLVVLLKTLNGVIVDSTVFERQRGYFSNQNIDQTFPTNFTVPTTGNYYVEFVYTSSAQAFLEISNFNTTSTPSLLPVSYASLSAKPLVNAVKIEWATTNEVNNSHFEVERTNDGENWINIGTVEGNGNTFSITNYEFVDNSPAQGVNIYRLKQVDWNGDFEYSITKTVLWGGESSKNSVQIFPNPSASTIQVSGVENPKVTVYNMAGVVMIQSENTNRMDLQELLKGVYFIHVQDAAGEVSRIRFIKE